MADEKKTVILDFQVDTKSAVVSIENLTKANKALRDERKSLDLSTDSGKAKAAELNSQIDKNTAVIKDNSSALEKQRLNVGNYTGALDKLVPGLGSTAQGFLGVGKAITTALIANPIGAIIAGIVLAITGLIKIFTGTEEGGDKLAKVMAQLSAIFGVIMDRAAMLGGALVKLFTGDFTGAANDAAKAVSGVAAEMANEIKMAGELAEILDALEDREISNSVAISKSALEIKNLIVQSKNRNLTEQQKIDLLTKATDLEVNQNKINKQIALDQLAAANRQIEMDFNQFDIKKKINESELEFSQRIIDSEEGRANVTADARKTIAEAINKVNDIEGESLVIQEKISNRIDAEILKQQAISEKRQSVALKEFEINKKRLQSYNDLEEKITENLEKRKIKEEETATHASLKAVQVTMNKQAELDKQAQAQRELTAKIIDEQDKENAEKLKKFIDGSTAIVNQIKTNADAIFGLMQGKYALEKNALDVSLANKETALNEDYSKELEALQDKLDKGLISEDEHKKQQLLLNSQHMSDIKKAEIDQAKALNEIKKNMFETDKKNRIADAIMSTVQAVIKTLASLPWPFNLIPAAAMGILGAAKINQIKQEQFVPAVFRKGGYTGDGDPNQLAGLTHKSEFVMPADIVSKFGKEHFQSYMDGSIMANAATGGIGGSSQPKIEVNLGLKEFNEFSNRVKLKESIVTA